MSTVMEALLLNFVRSDRPWPRSNFSTLFSRMGNLLWGDGGRGSTNSKGREQSICRTLGQLMDRIEVNLLVMSDWQTCNKGRENLNLKREIEGSEALIPKEEKASVRRFVNLWTKLRSTYRRRECAEQQIKLLMNPNRSDRSSNPKRRIPGKWSCQVQT